MKRLMKGFHRGEKGVTLIELLIVLAILGIIAAVIVLNVGGFTTSGNLTAANTEVQNVQSAVAGYYAENTTFPADTSGGVLDQWLSGTLKTDYDISNGKLTPQDDDAWGTDITWDPASQRWIKA